MRIFKVDMEWRYVSAYGKSEEENAPLLAAHEEKMAERLSFFHSLGLEVANIPHPCGIIVTEQQLVELMLAGEKPEVKQTIDVGRTPGDLSTLVGQLGHVIAKLSSIPAIESIHNERVNVHMPGQALATYNEVKLLEDSCSDILQSALDSGWRILAACPQPDARRPDYILGRFNPNRELENNAER